MRISEKGLNLIKEFEGCYLDAYKCPSHVWTIGWGHTGDVYEGQSITQEEADNILTNDMLEYEGYVNNCDNLTFTPNQNEFDALVSFVYNCGQGSLNTLVQNRDASTVADKLLLYNRGSDGILAGLVRRREAERVLFLDEDLSNSSSTQNSSSNTISNIGVVTASILNVRDNPSTDSNIIGTLNNGDKVKIDKEYGDWYSIFYSDHGGYVSKEYISLIDESNLDGVMATVTGITSYLNVRDSIGGNIIGKLYNGDSVKLYKKEGNWYHIYYGDSGGYVSADYITI